MSEDRIRVSFMPNYPAVTANCSIIPHFRVGSTCIMPGMAIEILNLITSYLNLTIDVVKVIPYTSKWDNLYTEILENQTDTYAFFSGKNIQGYPNKFDFTQTLFDSNIKFIIRQRDHSLEDIFAFSSIYSLNVWIFIAAVFILFTAFAMFIRYIEFKLKLRNKCNFSEILWNMTQLQLMQSGEIKYKLNAGRSSQLIFCIFQVCIIFGVFQGLILSSVVKKLNIAPYTVNEVLRLLRQNKLTLVVSPVTRNIADYQIENNYDLREALKANPYKIVNNTLDVIRKDKKAITMIGEYFWSIRNHKSNYCKLMAIDGIADSRPMTFIFKTGSRFTSMFDDAIKINNYKIRQITQKYLIYQTPSECKEEETGPMPLSITPFYGVLIIFIVGMLFGCFIFGGELLKWKIFDNKNESNKTAGKKDAMTRKILKRNLCCK